jgi:hypothetical protein
VTQGRHKPLAPEENEDSFREPSRALVVFEAVFIFVWVVMIIGGAVLIYRAPGERWLFLIWWIGLGTLGAVMGIRRLVGHAREVGWLRGDRGDGRT